MSKALAGAEDLEAAAKFLETHGQTGGVTEEQTVLTVARLRRDADETRRWEERLIRKQQWRAEFGTAMERLPTNRGKKS